MFTFFDDRPVRYPCDRLSRRNFLTIGGLGTCGLSLPALLRAEGALGVKPTGKSVINIYLGGGPTHMDTFDLKPEAPKEFRGEFMPIATKAPGLDICELMPQLASHGDKIAIVRSVVGLRNEHNASQSDSGWSVRDLSNIGGHPGVGPVMSMLMGPATSTPGGTAPTAVDLSGWTKPGFLGQVHSAYRPDRIGRANLMLDRRMTEDRFTERNRLRAEFDRFRASVDTAGMMDAVDSFAQRAVGIITSGRVAQALDVDQEEAAVIERFGGKRNRDAMNFLTAKRLIEADVRHVAFSIGGWDTHRNNFKSMRTKLPALDQSMSALLEALEDSGRLEETIIMMSGEFGRTPRINRTAGRDHWPQAGFFFLAGGGLRTGQAIGSTSRLGERADDRPVHLQEVFATVYHQLGIDARHVTLQDPNGRPQYLLQNPTPIAELV